MLFEYICRVINGGVFRCEYISQVNPLLMIVVSFVIGILIGLMLDSKLKRGNKK